MEAAEVTRRLRLVPIMAAALAGACRRPVEITGRGCSAPPEVEAAWRATDQAQELCGRKRSCWDEQIAVARALRDRFPAELLAHRVLVQHVLAARALPSMEAVRAGLETEYADLARRYPKNPAYPYLLGRLEWNRKKSRELLERSVGLDPNFPWAREALVRSLSWKPTLTDDDRRKAREHLEAFARSCPTRTGALLALLARFDDRPSWEAHAAALRAATKADGDRPEDLSALWELEFKYADPAQFASLRADVSGQVEDLRRQDRTSDRRWLSTLEEGYELTGDESGKRWVEDAALAKCPCEWRTTRMWFDRSQVEHGKFPDVEGKAQQKWLADQLAAIGPRLAQCPDESFLWQMRLHALAMSEGSPSKSLVEAGERVFAILGDAGGSPVADVWLDKGVALDRVGTLIDAADREAERDRKLVETAGLEGENLRHNRFYGLYEVTTRRALRVRLALARKDTAAAATALTGLEAAVNDLEKAAQTPGEKSDVAEPQAQLWKLRAEADVLAGREDEALAKYARAIEKSPDDIVGLLQGAPRSSAGATAPAAGLYLVGVGYD